jgi:hypothetical protein
MRFATQFQEYIEEMAVVHFKKLIRPTPSRQTKTDNKMNARYVVETEWIRHEHYRIVTECGHLGTR